MDTSHQAPSRQSDPVVVLWPCPGDIDFTDIEPAIVVRIYVQEGQFVNADDVLAEIDCPKICVELIAPCDGIVEKILVSQDQEVVGGGSLFVLKPLEDPKSRHSQPAD